MPVPPLMMMAWTCFVRHSAFGDPAFDLGRFIFDEMIGDDCMPLLLESFWISWPLVSVSGVRVSLQVITMHPIDLGAWDLCS